uniref:Uncharacterized protein n=1 Tax=Megaselia scalaris TaxID=36166 RepID=T1GF87_MEGSC
MAISLSDLRSQLVHITHFNGTHKEQAEKYRALLEKVLKNTNVDLIETLKLFIEASHKTKLQSNYQYMPFKW